MGLVVFGRHPTKCLSSDECVNNFELQRRDAGVRFSQSAIQKLNL